MKSVFFLFLSALVFLGVGCRFNRPIPVSIRLNEQQPVLSTTTSVSSTIQEPQVIDEFQSGSTTYVSQFYNNHYGDGSIVLQYSSGTVATSTVVLGKDIASSSPYLLFFDIKNDRYFAFMGLVCYGCDASPQGTVLFDASTHHSKIMPPVDEFEWQQSGRYRYKMYGCDYGLDAPACDVVTSTIPWQYGSF